MISAQNAIRIGVIAVGAVAILGAAAKSYIDDKKANIHEHDIIMGTKPSFSADLNGYIEFLKPRNGSARMIRAIEDAVAILRRGPSAYSHITFCPTRLVATIHTIRDYKGNFLKMIVTVNLETLDGYNVVTLFTESYGSV